MFRYNNIIHDISYRVLDSSWDEKIIIKYNIHDIGYSQTHCSYTFKYVSYFDEWAHDCL